MEEEINEAENAKNKTSDILTLLETKVEAMTEAEVGNDENLRNQALDIISNEASNLKEIYMACLLYTSPSPRDRSLSRMPSSA